MIEDGIQVEALNKFKEKVSKNSDWTAQRAN